MSIAMMDVRHINMAGATQEGQTNAIKESHYLKRIH